MDGSGDRARFSSIPQGPTPERAARDETDTPRPRQHPRRTRCRRLGHRRRNPQKCSNAAPDRAAARLRLRCQPWQAPSSPPSREPSSGQPLAQCGHEWQRHRVALVRVHVLRRAARRLDDGAGSLRGHAPEEALAWTAGARPQLLDGQFVARDVDDGLEGELHGMSVAATHRRQIGRRSGHR